MGCTEARAGVHPHRAWAGLCRPARCAKPPPVLWSLRRRLLTLVLVASVSSPCCGRPSPPPAAAGPIACSTSTSGRWPVPSRRHALRTGRQRLGIPVNLRRAPRTAQPHGAARRRCWASDSRVNGARLRVTRRPRATIQIAHLDPRGARARWRCGRDPVLGLLAPLLMLKLGARSGTLAPLARMRRRVAARAARPVPGTEGARRSAAPGARAQCAVRACAARWRRRRISSPTRRTNCARRWQRRPDAGR